MEADFHRVQFTPDLLPADITGSDIYGLNKAPSNFKPGHYFTIWCWPMKLIERQPKCNQLFWRPWLNAKYQLVKTPINFQSYF